MKIIVYQMFVVFFGLSCGAAAANETFARLELDEADRIRIERAVKERGLDPWGAQIGKMDANVDSVGEIAVCGMINQRNSTGGYTGFSPFFVTFSRSQPSLQVVLGQDVGDDLARSLCANAGLHLTVWPD